MPRVGEAFYELNARDQKLLQSLNAADARIRGSGKAVETTFGGAMDRAAPGILGGTTRVTTRMGGIFSSTFDRIGAGATRLGGVFGSSRVGGAFDRMGAAADGLSMRSRGLLGSFDRLTAGAGKLGGAIKGAGGVMSAFGIPPILGYAAAVGGVIALLKRGVDSASSMNETVSKVGVVFGQSGPEILRWGENAATSLGMSKQAALEAAGTFGNLFVALKLPSDQVPKMSEGLIQLAADLASFNNVDPAEALDALRSGLVGETEPLRRFGVNLNEATIAQKALELGLIASVKQGVTPAIKAQATYALIMEQTATAQGDFARTSSGLANQQRISAAKIEDAFARMGQKLLPLATKLVPMLADAFVGLVDIIGEAVDVIGDVATFLGKANDQLTAILPVLKDVNFALPLLGAAALGVTGKLTGLGGAGLGAKLGLLGLAAELADTVKPALDDAAGSLHDFLFPHVEGRPDFGLHPEEWPWPLGPKDAPEWAGGTPKVDTSAGIEKWGGKLADDMASAIEAGAPKIETAADAIAKPITDAQKAAQAEAARIAGLTPFEIAKSIREGADPVKMAADLLADAIENGIAPAKEIANIQGTLAGAALQKALNSKIPDIRAAGQAYKSALEDRLFALQHGVPDIAVNTGVDYAAALAGQRAAVGTAARTMLATARAKIISLKSEATGFGDSTGDAYGGALAAALRAKLSLVLAQLRAYRTAMAAGSPPKPGAVLYGIERWGYATGEAYADPFARALGEGVADARDKLGGLAALLSGSRAAGALSMTPAAGLLTGAAPGVRMGLDTGIASGTSGSKVDVGGIVVQMQIDRLDAADPVAIRDLGRALGAEIRLSLTRSPASFALPNA